jgi:RNA polymerase sigma-70 factor (ECF subfamily)
MLRSFPVVSKWDQTDDVLQVALVRLCSALRAAPPASPEHFLHLATLQIRRELIDLARHYRGRRDMESLNVEDSKGNEVRNVMSPDGAPGGLDEWAAFHEAVGKLPDDERVVVELRWYQELSEEDTARLLDISERTARRRWRDARLRLSERLNGCLPE